MVLLFLIVAAGTVNAQAPDAAKECAELQKTSDNYTVETARIKLSLSFKTNPSYWQGALAELSFGIARRKLVADLRAIAFKLDVKRLKEWSMASLEEKLEFQRTVSRALEREQERAIVTNQADLEARAAEIERQLKTISMRNRDLGCADIPRDENAGCAVPEVAGTYITAGDSAGMLVLTQTGARVTGKFGKDESSLVNTLEGELKCGVLTGTFLNTVFAVTGKFSYTFSPDGAGYSGTWRSDAGGTPIESSGRRK